MIPPKVWKLHETVGCKDIYEFLKSSKGASLDDLRTAADKKYVSIHNQSSRNEVARAGADLAGLCKSHILKDDRRKGEYDRELLARSRSKPDAGRPDRRPDPRPDRAAPVSPDSSDARLSCRRPRPRGRSPYRESHPSSSRPAGVRRQAAPSRYRAAPPPSRRRHPRPARRPRLSSRPRRRRKTPWDSTPRPGGGFRPDWPRRDSPPARWTACSVPALGAPSGDGRQPEAPPPRGTSLRLKPPPCPSSARPACGLRRPPPRRPPTRPARPAPPRHPVRQHGPRGPAAVDRPGARLLSARHPRAGIELDGADVGATGATGMLLLSDVQPGRHVIVARKEDTRTPPVWSRSRKDVPRSWNSPWCPSRAR